MSCYEVTAVLEDNRENTQKVCTTCENSMDAVDAIIEKVCRDQKTTPQAVIETWSILYLSCRCCIDPVDGSFVP